MFSSLVAVDGRSRGPLLIGVGLAIVSAAQFVGGVPVAAAMALVGWGVLLTVRTEALALANLLVYGVLVSFTIASQTHAAQQSVLGRLSVLTAADHVAAILLLVALTLAAVQRTAGTCNS
jgi:hypothetical protein